MQADDREVFSVSFAVFVVIRQFTNLSKRLRLSCREWRKMLKRAVRCCFQSCRALGICVDGLLFVEALASQRQFPQGLRAMRLCFVEACARALLRVAQDVESRSKAFGFIGLLRARFGQLGFVIQAPSLRPKASVHI